MKIISIRQFGNLISEYEINEGQELLVGRDDSCQIILNNDKSISRQHLKITLMNGLLNIEVLSKYSEFLFRGKPHSQLQIENDQAIQLNSYEITLNEKELKEVTSSNLLENTENTFVSTQFLKPFIKIYKDKIEMHEMELEGAFWVAGRDSACHLLIRDPRVSRRQFEISFLGDQYYIKDLGSVNGTLINGKEIDSKDPILLSSGDEISVLDNRVVFELRDPTFQEKVNYTSDLLPNPVLQNFAISTELSHAPQAKVNPSQQTQKFKFDYQKNKKTILIGAVAMLAVIIAMPQDKKDSKTDRKVASTSKHGPVFDQLPAEQKVIVKQTYQLSKNLYMQGKYELARQEVSKIYQYVPEYEDSKELETVIQQAILSKQEIEKADRIEKQKAEIEQKIDEQYQVCKQKINSQSTVEQLESCLLPVMEFNPDHPKITELRNQVQLIVDDRNIQDANRADYIARSKKTEALFNKAEQVYRSGDLLAAIQSYKVVIRATTPDPKSLKSVASRRIASIENGILNKISNVMKESDKLYAQKNLKEAVVLLETAQKVNPDNEDIKSKSSKIKNELKKEMSVYFQEAILEESVGNVEVAKQKWLKIIELDVKSGDYYSKAKMKLKKYGAYVEN